MASRSRKPRRSARPAGRPDKPADRDRIIDCALALFAERGWREVTLADVAAAAGVPMAGLHPLFASKIAILRAFVGRIDGQVLAGAPEEGASVRERLFDVFMRRFDALQAHRAALQALARDLPRDPLAALCLAQRTTQSLRAMAELAGVGTEGPLGALRVKALGALHLWTMRAWLADDSADMARTMKALDQGLERLEMLARSLPRPGGETRRAAAG